MTYGNSNDGYKPAVITVRMPPGIHKAIKFAAAQIKVKHKGREYEKTINEFCVEAICDRLRAQGVPFDSTPKPLAEIDESNGVA